MSALQTAQTTIQTDLSSLQATVGNAGSGLVHRVNGLCAFTVLGVPLSSACT